MSSLLSLRHVSKSYWRDPNETVVLADISLDVHGGEVVAIWGQRGSGKTTLATIAAGIDVPDHGVVLFEGRDLNESRSGLAYALHEGIGWLERMGPGDDLPIIDYVALPLFRKHSPRYARRHAVAALARVGIAECATERWETLSDGERTLVTIAHALVRSPRLLIADTPTANLDLFQREEVMGLLRSAADEDNLGVLITVPDMPEAVHADQIGSLSAGKLLLVRDRDEPGTNVVDFPASKRSA
jgi:putative ABC transport system ATP-binding protein